MKSSVSSVVHDLIVFFPYFILLTSWSPDIMVDYSNVIHVLVDVITYMILNACSGLFK